MELGHMVEPPARRFPVKRGYVPKTRTEYAYSYESNQVKPHAEDQAIIRNTGKKEEEDGFHVQHHACDWLVKTVMKSHNGSSSLIQPI